MGKFLQDFKEFAMKGNIIDMAVGVIVGGAFGKIVSSLVKRHNHAACISHHRRRRLQKSKIYNHGSTSGNRRRGAAVEEVAVNYGLFIQNIVDFLIIALSIFVALRVVMKFMKKEKEAEETPAPAEPTKEETLLTEIRDLLRKQSEK